MTPLQSYREIPLTKGQVTKVSPRMYDYLMQWNWCAQWSPTMGKFYAVRNSGTKKVRMHREVLGLQHGDPRISDHINGDTLDNTDENLRAATASENNRNRRYTDRNNNTGFKGVSFDKTSPRKYKASIKFNRKSIYLGSFNTAEGAYAAYCAAAKELHGEFARLA